MSFEPERNGGRLSPWTRLACGGYPGCFGVTADTAADHTGAADKDAALAQRVSLNNFMLDTHAAVKRLHAAGIDEAQAEAIVDVIHVAIPDPLDALATKPIDFLIGP